MTQIAPSAGQFQSAQLQAPSQRLPERPPIQQTQEAAEANRAATASAPRELESAAEDLQPNQQPQAAVESRDVGARAEPSLNQLTARGSEQPRSERQIEQQREQLQNAVQRAETPVPEPQIDAQA